MPNAVTAFVPQLALDALVTQLDTIQRTAGYQTQPLVTTDARKWDGALDVAALLVQGGRIETPEDDTKTGPTFTATQTITVYGRMPCATGDPQKELHKLLQDTLTAIYTGVATIATSIGRGVFLGLVSIETDEQVLVDAGYSNFAITLLVRWCQGTTW